ncbi:MAG TPA: carboxypeptidase regulatory-like domain-containing protein, partial [Bacteroidales bacterium]|nr:carboxypeptidase regulatory-like domain-containing protein [Bacteroidales bacterium]
GQSPVYQWKVNGFDSGTNSSTFTYTPQDGDQVQCILTSSLSCTSNNPATSNTLSATVTPISAVAVSIAANPSGAVCAGASVTYSATPANPGQSPVYQWKVNGFDSGTNSSTFTYAPQDGDQVQCILTSSLSCTSNNPASSNTLNAVVTPIAAVAVSIEANPSGAVCAGASVTYTATPSNPGQSPVYQWKVNGLDAGTNSSTFTFTPQDGDQVQCILTSSLSCTSNNPATSNTLIAAVTPISAVAVAIEANPSGAVCAGASVTYTATPSNPGQSPVYQWKVNGLEAGTNSSTFTFTPQDGDQVQCILTSSLSCTSNNPATSNTLVSAVTPISAVAVSIAANPSGTVCAGASVTYTATPTNPGQSPVYQWKVNGLIAGTNNSSFTFTPQDGDQVQCILTSSLSCTSNNPATSNIIVGLVNSISAVSVTIASSASGSVCAGQSVTFTASPVNPGPSPIYQWKVNGLEIGTNSITLTYIPEDGDQVHCELTSSLSCTSNNPAISNTLVISVTPLAPVSISVQVSPSNQICQGQLVTFTASYQNGGSNPLIQWYKGGTYITSGISFSTSGCQQNDVIYAVLTSNAACAQNNPATSNVIVMNVQAYVNAGIQILQYPSGVICEGNAVNFFANIQNGGSNPAYQWMVNGLAVGGNSQVFTYQPQDTDMVWCTLTSSLLCVMNNPVVSNTMNPVVEALPVVNLGNDTTIGLNQSMLLDAGPGFASYLWNNGQTTQTILASETGLYAVTVSTDNQCQASDTLMLQVGYGSFGGYVRYDNNNQTPIPNALVKLKQGDSIVQTTTTDQSGYYSFSDYTFGTYTLEVSSSLQWGGVNAIDGLITMRHFVGMLQLSGLRFKAGDVDGNNFINSNDAMATQKRFVGIINSFPIGNWVFEKPQVILDGSIPLTQQIRGICAGDVDASYIFSGN